VLTHKDVLKYTAKEHPDYSSIEKGIEDLNQFIATVSQVPQVIATSDEYVAEDSEEAVKGIVDFSKTSRKVIRSEKKVTDTEALLIEDQKACILQLKLLYISYKEVMEDLGAIKTEMKPSEAVLSSIETYANVIKQITNLETELVTRTTTQCERPWSLAMDKYETETAEFLHLKKKLRDVTTEYEASEVKFHGAVAKKQLVGKKLTDAEKELDQKKKRIFYKVLQALQRRCRSTSK
jgi:hypothetical protein